jgi:hypothetical protein
MTVATRWIHKIDGIDISDGVHFITTVPEAEAEFGAQVLMTEMQARTPVFNRQQPVAGRFTFLITNLDCLEAAQNLVNLTVLRALVAPGQHVYMLAILGQDVAGHTLNVYFDAGMTVDTENGLCTAKAIAPDPTWS